jgi:hypothetical protein
MTTTHYQAFDGTDRSVDELYDVLRAERRRQTLAVLTERQTPMPAEQIARAVAMRETDASQPRASESHVREVQLSLHHVHLPKLDAVGLIDHDPDAGTVESAAANLPDLLPPGTTVGD